MSESYRNSSKKTGLPPGSLVHVGDVLETVSKITLVDYSKESVEERQLGSLDEIQAYRDRDSVTWVIVEGLTNVDVIENVGSLFGIHPLVLEDILNTHQRPKFEEYEDYLFLVLKCLLSEGEEFSVNSEQISLLVLDNFVFTFKEKADDLLAPLLLHIRNGKSRFRSLGSDYLMYAILDTIVDQGFILMEALDDAVTALEDALFANPTQHTLNKIQKLKREVITVKRRMSPIRELMSGLLRSQSGLIHESTYLYLRDVSDHTTRVLESVESYREILSGLLDIYMSSLSNKMNEVMKVLTVFASIFIPLTFLVGIYGMNFEYMPELKWKWAYPALWAVFIAIPAVLLVYFKKKKWL
jgi:magnesium transporter